MAVQNLSVNLIAKTSSFMTGMQKASGALSGFAKSAGAFANKAAVGMAAGAAAATYAVNRLYYAMKGPTMAAMENIDAMVKLSDATGIATESLAGLKYAADLNGSSIDAVSGSIVAMNKNLFGAAGASKNAKTAIAGLGLQYDQLQSMSPEQRFAAIADALSKVKDETQRMALGTALFGKKYMDVANVIQIGADGLKDAQIQAKKFNLEFSKIDGYQVAAANDAITNMGMAINGAYQQLAIQLSPYIQYVSEEIIDMGQDGAGAFDGMTGAVGVFVESLDMAMRAVDTLKAGWYMLNSFENEKRMNYAKSQKEVYENLASQAKAEGDSVKEFAYNSKARKFAKEEEQFAKATIDNANKTEDSFANMYGKRLEDMQARVKAIKEEMKLAAEARANGGGPQVGTATGMTPASRSLSSGAGSLMSYSSKFVDIAAMSRSGSIEQKTLTVQQKIEQNLVDIKNVLKAGNRFYSGNVVELAG